LREGEGQTDSEVRSGGGWDQDGSVEDVEGSEDEGSHDEVADADASEENGDGHEETETDAVSAIRLPRTLRGRRCRLPLPSEEVAV
jgi:hypothetical protein